MKHDLGFDLMPRLRLVFGQIAAACSHLAIAIRDGKDPSDVSPRLPLHSMRKLTLHIVVRVPTSIGLEGMAASSVSYRIKTRKPRFRARAGQQGSIWR